MKVDQNSLGAAGSSQLSRSQETQSAGGSKERQGASRYEAGSDAVQLSDFSSRLLSLAQSDPPDQAARIESLTALVRSGKYQVDSADVSRRMVDEALRHAA